MTRLTPALLAVVAVLAVAFALTLRAGADSADISSSTLRIGEQATLVIEVATAPGATVEVDPAAASWAGVEVVRIVATSVDDSGLQAIHRIELVVAPFEPGAIEFAPAVNVIAGTEVAARVLPPLRLDVRPSLAPDAPLELSPLPPPEAIGGGESPLLRPALAAGAVAVVLAVAALGILGATALRRRRPAAPAPAASAAPPSLEGAERALEHDPVVAYRTLAATVRSVIASRYGLPASALTTAELQRRMEAQGVDRWQARLVGGLLEECDSVVYAGYRPAPERRRSDLTMAREIVEAS